MFNWPCLSTGRVSKQLISFLAGTSGMTAASVVLAVQRHGWVLTKTLWNPSEDTQLRVFRFVGLVLCILASFLAVSLLLQRCSCAGRRMSHVGDMPHGFQITRSAI